MEFISKKLQHMDSLSLFLSFKQCQNKNIPMIYKTPDPVLAVFGFGSRFFFWFGSAFGFSLGSDPNLASGGYDL